MVVELKSGSTIAKVDTKGAELISFKDVFGIEYMWQKDAAYWGRSSPVLFPIVGNLRENKTMIEGKEYQISKHGFCRDAEFRITYQSDTSVILSYSSNEETLAQYPYRFTLTLAYQLEDTGITIRYTVMNMDDKPIDYCLGAHPAFNVPVDGNGGFEDCRLVFEQPETARLPVFDFERNQINMENRVTYMENQRELPLKYSYFDNDALIFGAPNSKSVQIVNTRTGRGVEVAFEGFPFVAFWTPIKLGAPFLCIEPWCGMAVCSDEGDEYAKKRGIQHLEVNESREYSLTILPL